MKHWLSTFLFSTFATLNLTPMAAYAKDVSMLFIGNSYTYLEGIGHDNDPALPKLVRDIARSIDPSVNVVYSARTIGGSNLETHLKDAQSLELMSKRYDKVIVQGQSMEALFLTPWWASHGNLGAKAFQQTLPRLLDIIYHNNADVTLYLHWGKNPKNELLAETHPGLYFPPGSTRAGQKWCGRDKFEYQALINAGYARAARNYPANYAKVGNAWLWLQEQGIVSEDELYIPGDWTHASITGGYIAALVLVRDVLHLDISKNKYRPDGISAEKSAAILQSLNTPAAKAFRMARLHLENQKGRVAPAFDFINPLLKSNVPADLTSDADVLLNSDASVGVNSGSLLKNLFAGLPVVVSSSLR